MRLLRPRSRAPSPPSSPPVGQPAPVPYIAPWASRWTQYSTQTYTMPVDTPTRNRLTAPSGQWWRVLFVTTVAQTSALAGDRQVHLDMGAPGATAVNYGAVGSQPASVQVAYTFGVGLSAYANSVVAGAQSQAVPLVDILWPQGTNFSLVFTGKLAGDSFVAPPLLAVEIYTEFRDEQGAVTLIPTPVLT